MAIHKWNRVLVGRIADTQFSFANTQTGALVNTVHDAVVPFKTATWTMFVVSRTVNGRLRPVSQTVPCCEIVTDSGASLSTTLRILSMSVSQRRKKCHGQGFGKPNLSIHDTHRVSTTFLKKILF